MPEWVCSKCGSPGATPIPGMLQFDPRYTTGYCDTCSDPHPKKPRKTPRPVSPLVRADAFDRDAWTTRREKEELTGLVKDWNVGLRPDGKGGTMNSMPEAQVIRLVYLYDRHGAPGFHLPESARDGADKYRRAEESRAAHKPKAKRGRGA